MCKKIAIAPARRRTEGKMLTLKSGDQLEYRDDSVGYNCNYEFPYLHTHDYWEFVYVKYDIEHVINGASYNVPANSVLIIRPTDRHLIRAIPNNKLNPQKSPTHLNVKITTPALEKLLEGFSPRMLETLSAALTPPHLQQTLSVFRWMFCILSVVAVFALCFHFAPYRVGHRTKMMLFPVLFGAGCLAILAYQATWQLAGYTRTEFVRFMERYNPRPDNAAHHLIRGTINDCHGVALAYTERDGSGRRVYPYDFSTAHIVGFRHPSEGLTGMENAADPILSGYHRITSGKEWREASLKALGKQDMQVGTNVTLTVDARLQLCAYSLLRGRKGAAVAIEPATGDILCMVSAPSYDPHLMVGRDRGKHHLELSRDKWKPLLNRAVSGTYPPGSTFKTTPVM